MRILLTSFVLGSFLLAGSAMAGQYKVGLLSARSEIVAAGYVAAPDAVGITVCWIDANGREQCVAW